MTSAKKGHGGRRGPKGIRRYVLGGIVALVLALFSGVIWFAYQDLMPGGDEAPPLIRADAAPIKRDPDERGGLPLVNEESAVVQSLDEPDSPVRVERILPRETVAPRSTADVIPEVLEAEPVSDSDLAFAGTALDPATAAGVADATAGPGDTLDTLLAEIVDGEAGTSAPAGGLAAEPAAGTAADAELPLPADGIAEPEREVTAPAPAPAPATSTIAAPAAIPALPAAVLAPTPAPQAAPAPQLPATQPQATQPPAAVATPRASAPAETTVAALPRPALAQDFTGAFGVQLLAVRDEAAAAGAWTGLQQRHPAVLGNLRSRVQRAEIGGNTFYRLQAGPFADRAGASAVCSALQSRGTDCFIVEPTS
jgi:hypothetical protein